MASFLKVLPRIVVHKGMPLQFIFFITSRCNLKCKHCFYTENLNKPENELSISEIKKTSKSMGPLLWFAMTGGEPFLRKDITEIAEIFYQNNKPNLITITTNGLLQNPIIKKVPDICRKCKKSHLIVYVSLDGLEKTHDEIRGTSGVFKKAIGTIQKLKEMKKEFKNLSVATVTTINAENQKEMKELALFIKDKVKPDSMTINMIRGKPRSSPLGNVDLKHYFEFIKIQEKALKKRDVAYFNFFGKTFVQKRESLQKRIISTTFKENRYMIPCLAGSISCVMTETGDLYPCEILDMKIGNIRDNNYNFRRLWYSNNAKKIRKFIKKTKCYCTYECALTTSILFNMWQLIRMWFRK